MGIIGKLLVSAMTGTAFMTLYSYYVSNKENKQYREPQLLNALLRRSHEDIELSERKSPVGYVLHYIVGIGFVLAYVPLWQNTPINPNWKSGLVLGFVSGLIGVVVWETTLQLHPDPPKIDKRGYYRQLVMAHVIFGSTASAHWKLMGNGMVKTA